MRLLWGLMLCAAICGPMAASQPSSEPFLSGIRKGHSNDQLPFKLVVHAGAAAAKVTANPILQRSFVSAYSKGVVEGLVFGPDASLQTHCDRIKDEQGKAIACGLALGTEVGARKQFDASLEDFGFLEQDVRGIVRLDVADRLVVDVEESMTWELRHSPATKALDAGKCYVLHGFLSNEGVFGSGDAPYTREFITITAEKLKEGC